MQVFPKEVIFWCKTKKKKRNLHIEYTLRLDFAQPVM